MTNLSMALSEPAEKGGNADMLRGMLHFAA